MQQQERQIGRQTDREIVIQEGEGREEGWGWGGMDRQTDREA